VLVLCACRGRTRPDHPDAAATAAPRVTPVIKVEKAALLLVDREGAAKLPCLPAPSTRRELFSGVKLLQALDVVWRDGRIEVAALVADSRRRSEDVDQLVLLASDAPPRVLATGARPARFSPYGDALAFETARREHLGGGVVTQVRSSHVLDLGSGEPVELVGVVDPWWEADGKHLRANRLSKRIEDRGHATGVRWDSLRVRWDRQTRTLETWRRGSAQLPAPSGTAVAWSEDQASALAPSHCAVRLGRAGHQHPIVGPFCMGIADDRGGAGGLGTEGATRRS
jgi:hypothetical protein